MTTLLTGPFLAAFAVTIGANNEQVGLFTAIMLIGQPIQLVGLLLLQKWSHRKRIILICASLGRLALLPIVVVSLRSTPPRLTFLFAWFLIHALITSASGPAWNSLLKAIVPADALGEVFSKRIAWGTLTGLILTLASGFGVDLWQTHIPSSLPWTAYGVFFAFGLALGLLGVATIAPLPDPPLAADPEGRRLGSLLALPFKDSQFRPVLLFASCWSFVNHLATPFFIVYMLEALHLSLGTTMLFTALSQLTQVCFAGWWGRVADRYSSRAVMAACIPLIVCANVGWLFVRLPEPHVFSLFLLAAIQVATGMAMSGMRLAVAKITLKMSPAAHAHIYAGVVDIVAGLAGAVAPIGGGWLADFFIQQHFELIVSWTGALRSVGFHLLSIQGLNFLFLIAALCSAITLQCLNLIDEPGGSSQGVSDAKT
jgi:MFS family permease